jgi:hydroxyethylthiazole kinase-like sugar kinase family protein
MEKDILREFSEMQKMRDKLLLEIGQLYVNNYEMMKQNTAIPTINEKVLVFQKIEARLIDLEGEVIVMGTA